MMNRNLRLAHSKARQRESVRITGVWLRRIGDDAQVLVETNGQWRLVCTEKLDGNFSHIVEPAGILSAPIEAMGG